MKKKISICVGCFNEEANIEPLYKKIIEVMENVEKYDFELIYSDNDSTDKSQEILRNICRHDERVKAIFNTRNFGASRSGKNALFAASGDAVIGLACDFQEPPELIPTFIQSWEKGNLITLGQKLSTREKGIKALCRKLYYKIIDSFSEVRQYSQITGFGIFDKKIIAEIKELNEPDMAMRHILAELGHRAILIPYMQNKRRAGKSSFNMWRYLDFSINSLIRTSKFPLRIATVLGFFISIISFLIGMIYFVIKLINWDSFSIGIAPIIIGIFFMGSIQLLFIGLIGEYIGAIFIKTNNHPIVFENERINF